MLPIGYELSPLYHYARPNVPKKSETLSELSPAAFVRVGPVKLDFRFENSLVHQRYYSAEIKDEAQWNTLSHIMWTMFQQCEFKNTHDVDELYGEDEKRLYMRVGSDDCVVRKPVVDGNEWRTLDDKEIEINIEGDVDLILSISYLGVGITENSEKYFVATWNIVEVIESESIL